MRLREAIHIYLICIRAEGRSAPVARKYRYVLTWFLDVVEDMDLRALTPDHVQYYLGVIPVTLPSELSMHEAVLQFFSNWVRVQHYLHPARISFRPWAMPRFAAVREKLPVAL